MSEPQTTTIAAVQIPIPIGILPTAEGLSVRAIWRFQTLGDDMDDQTISEFLVGAPIGTRLVIRPDTVWWQSGSTGPDRLWERSNDGDIPDEVATTDQLVATLQRPRRHRGIMRWLRGGLR